MTTSDGYVLKMERMPRRSAPTSVPSLHWHRHPCHWYRSLHPAADDRRHRQGGLLLLASQGVASLSWTLPALQHSHQHT